MSDAHTIDPPKYIWRFAGAMLSESNRELIVLGEAVHLESKHLDVLLCLLRAEGELVTKQELFDQVWTGRVVTDGVLSQAIKALRNALSDDEKSIIRTVHGHGFRLDVPIDVEGVEEPAGPQLELSAGMAVHGLDGWVLEERLQTRPSNELWRIKRTDADELGVLKLALDVRAERALRREVTLNRVLQKELGDNPPLVPLVQWQFDQQPHWVRMPWYENGSLGDWVKTCGGADSISLARRIRIVAEAAEAFAKAHAIGVMHKDIKPGNLLVDAAGKEPRLLLCDFGNGTATSRARLARAGVTVMGFTQTLAVDPDTGSGTSGSATTAGTPAYMAPELLKGGVFSEKSDVYSLGVMLYQLVSGEMNSPLAHGWEEDIDDAGLRQIIGQACAGRPQRRYGGMLEFAEALRAWTPGAVAEESGGSSTSATQQDGVRLTAILFSDIAGYSSKVRANELNARTMLDAHRALMRRLVAQHHGREIETAGDSFLIEFPSVVSAMECAIAHQKAQAELNEQSREELRFQVRIGVHIGEVEFRSGKVFGHGVNYAARIEPFSPHGGIAVSPAAKEAVEARMPLPFVSLGRQQLKNVAENIEVFALDEVAIRTGVSGLKSRAPSRRGMSAGIAAVTVGVLVLVSTLLLLRDRPSEAPATPAPVVATTELRTERVAILPFELLGLDERTRQIMGGLQDALASQLAAQLRLALVQGSDPEILGKDRSDVTGIGTALNAGQLIRGSVQQMGDQLRVNLQLIDARQGQTRWGHVVDGSTEALFDLQDAIASSLVGELGLMQDAQPETRPGSNSGYADYLQALAQWRSIQGYSETRESLQAALALADSALEQDPGLLPAHLLALRISVRAYYSGVTARKITEQRFVRHREALRINGASDFDLAIVDALYQAHMRWNDRSAADLLRPFTAQARLDHEALKELAEYSVAGGYIEDGLALWRRAVEAEPTDLNGVTFMVNHEQTFGDPFDAIAVLESAFSRLPTRSDILLMLAHLAHNLTNEIDYLQKVAEIGPAGRAFAAVPLAYAQNDQATLRSTAMDLLETAEPGTGYHGFVPGELRALPLLMAAGADRAELEALARQALPAVRAARAESDSFNRQLSEAILLAVIGDAQQAQVLVDAAVLSMPRSASLAGYTWAQINAVRAEAFSGPERMLARLDAFLRGREQTYLCTTLIGGAHFSPYIRRHPDALPLVRRHCEPYWQRNRERLEPFRQRFDALIDAQLEQANGG